ncbi:MAG: FtsX-like permease family protein [Candidatus Odinarchaeota archaeon]
MAAITPSFIYIVFKKLITNRRKFFTFLTCLILSTALLSGISIFVDSASRSVLESYFEEDRSIDIMIKSSNKDPREHAETIKELSVSQRELNWIENAYAGYRWHFPLFTHLPPENITFDDAMDGTLTFVLSAEQGFYQDFDFLFDLIAGEFNIGLGKAVISESLAAEYSVQVGDRMSIFTWWLSRAGPYWRFVPEWQDINNTNIITITGIVADTSKFFDEQLIGGLSLGFNIIGREGGLLTDFSAMPEMTYFQNFRFQWNEGGFGDQFDNIVFVKSTKGILDLINPGSSIEKTRYLERESREDVYPITTAYVFRSPLRNALEEYRFWLSSARIFLTALSLPVILIGWYLLNFSFSHTFEERKREIAALKSRGLSNAQIWFIVLFEAFTLGVIGATAGILLGIILNAIMEVNVSFLVFNLSKFNFEFISAITPFTLIITAAAAIVIMIIVSILPVRSIINLPVDEITQAEVEIGMTEYFTFNQFKTSVILTVIGFLIIAGVFSSARIVASDFFIVIIAIIGLTAFIIGSLTFMASFARFLPLILEKLHIGLNSPHLFLVARELSRRSKKTTAAFLVLSLTLAFGIFTTLTIQNTTNYLMQESSFQVGSDIAFDYSFSSGFGDIPEHNYKRLLDPEIYPEITNIVRFLQYPGYILDESSDYPADPMAIVYRVLNQQENLNVIFINSTEYLKSAYYRDYFCESNETSPLRALSESAGAKVLIDRYTAEEWSLSIGDTVRFTTGRHPGDVYRGLAVIVGLVDYFSPGLVTGEDSFIIVDRGSLNDEFRSAEFTSTTFLIELSDPSRGLEIAERILSDNQLYGIVNLYTIQELITHQTDDFITLMRTLNLDFYYSLILSAIGFLIVLEIRVQERKKEIGVIKALGMSNNQTISMILVEGGVSITVASLAGLFTGIVSGAMFAPILLIKTLPQELVIPWNIFIVQLILVIIFAFVGTFVPARLTNKWIPADLIKQEG